MGTDSVHNPIRATQPDSTYAEKNSVLGSREVEVQSARVAAKS